MRMIFVRHGHPDYQKDCLTELGRKHAEAVADRLRDEKICKIYSSTCGRAFETAGFIAKLHNMDVESFDFMRELSWGSADDEEILHGGQPWYTADEMVAGGQDILSTNWESEEPFCRNKVVSSGRVAWQGFDSLLAEHGYKREGMYYRVLEENDNTYVMASHGGSSSAVISHIFNIPFPFICHSFRPAFTAITIVNFNGKPGSLTAPVFEIVNDAKHIEAVASQVTFDR